MEEDPRASRRVTLRRAASVWSGVLSTGHLGLALAAGSGGLGWALGGAALAALAPAAPTFRHGGRRASWLLVALVVLQGGLFAATLASLAPPFPARPLLVVLVVGYLGLALLASARALPFPEAGAAILLALSVTLSLLGLEAACTAILARVQSVAPVDPTYVVGMRGAFAADPVIGPVPPPGGRLEQIYPDNPRGYFRERVVTEPSSPPRKEYYVAYAFNDRGCRAPEYAVPAPPGTFRIVMLGDSYVMGWGVHAEDMVSTVLEGLLNAGAASAPTPRRFEVIACAMAGFSTREARLYYDLRARAYAPDLVLLGMVHNDDRSAEEELEAGGVHVPGRWEHLFRTLFLIEEARHAYRPRDFSRSMDDLAGLHRRAAEDGAAFGVFVFADFGEARRHGLPQTAESTAAALAVPFLDLSTRQTGNITRESVTVHPLDGHPNEVAHRAAAGALLAWLAEEALIPR